MENYSKLLIFVEKSTYMFNCVLKKSTALNSNKTMMLDD